MSMSAEAASGWEAGRGAALLVRSLIALLGFYRQIISPLLPPSCRFTPTCSQYAIDAISKHGPFKGAVFTLLRLLRCHPLHPGGYDPA